MCVRQDYDSLPVIPQSPPLTIDGTVMKEFDDIDIFGATFDCKMTFESIFARYPKQFLRRCILTKFWRVFHDRLLLGRCFGVLSCPFWSTILQCDDRLQYWTLLSVVSVL